MERCDSLELRESSYVDKLCLYLYQENANGAEDTFRKLIGTQTLSSLASQWLFIFLYLNRGLVCEITVYLVGGEKHC